MREIEIDQQLTCLPCEALSRRHFSIVCFNCHSSICREAKYRRSNIPTYPTPTPTQRSRVPVSTCPNTIRAIRRNVNSSETPTRSGRSHHGLLSFMPAQRRSQDMGWRLSFETATAHWRPRAGAPSVSTRRNTLVSAAKMKFLQKSLDRRNFLLTTKQNEDISSNPKSQAKKKARDKRKKAARKAEIAPPKRTSKKSAAPASTST